MLFFFLKQKTAYELLACWSSGVCSSDLEPAPGSRGRNDGVTGGGDPGAPSRGARAARGDGTRPATIYDVARHVGVSIATVSRSEEGRVGKEGRSRWTPDH